MNILLKLSAGIDQVTVFIAKKAIWVVLIIVLISAGNAVMRYAFNYSSNAFLDIQWNLFGLIFLSSAGYTFLRNEHVRIDVFAGRFSRRVQTWIDIFGIIFFLLPMAFIVLILSWPVFIYAWESGEMSNSAGGLSIWPSRLMVLVGFFLLIMQAFSELIKRIGFLKNACPDPTLKPHSLTPEEEIAEAIKLKLGALK